MDLNIHRNRYTPTDNGCLEEPRIINDIKPQDLDVNDFNIRDAQHALARTFKDARDLVGSDQVGLYKISRQSAGTIRVTMPLFEGSFRRLP
jgi:hypothetical protein